MKTRSMEESMPMYKPPRRRKTQHSPQKQQQQAPQKQQHSNSNQASTPPDMQRSSSIEPHQQDRHESAISSLSPDDIEQPELLSALGSFAEIDFGLLSEEEEVGDLLATNADGLGDIDIKATLAARLVLQGKSLATALGEFKTVQGQPLDALGVAKTTFNLAESQVHSLWERGYKPPRVEWIEDCQASTGEKRKATSDEQRQVENGGSRRRTEAGAYHVQLMPRIAALGIHSDLLRIALAEVYDRPVSLVETADLNSFAASYPNVLPLLTARAKFVSIRDGLLVDTGIRNARHMAEHEAARRVADRLDEQLRSVMNRARSHAALVASNIEVIRERARALAPGRLSDLTKPVAQSSSVDVGGGGYSMENDDVSVWESQTQDTQRSLASQAPPYHPLVPLPASQLRTEAHGRVARMHPIRPATSQRFEYFTPPEARSQQSRRAEQQTVQFDTHRTQHQRMMSHDFALPSKVAEPSSTPGKTVNSDRTLGASDVDMEREREREHEPQEEEEETQRRGDIDLESQPVTAEVLETLEAVEQEFDRRVRGEASSPGEEEAYGHEQQLELPEHRSSSEQHDKHWTGEHDGEGSQHSSDGKQRDSSVLDDMYEKHHAKEDPSLDDLLAPVRPERQAEQLQSAEDKTNAPRNEEHSLERSDRTETIDAGGSSIWASDHGNVSQSSALPPSPKQQQKLKSLLATLQPQETASQFDELREAPSSTQQKRTKAKPLPLANRLSKVAAMPPPLPSQKFKLSDKETPPSSSSVATRGGGLDASVSNPTPSHRASSPQFVEAVRSGKLASYFAGRRPTLSSGSTSETHNSSATMPSSSTGQPSTSIPRTTPLAAHENRTYQQDETATLLEVSDIGPQPSGRIRRSSSAEPTFAFDENANKSNSANRHGFEFDT